MISEALLSFSQFIAQAQRRRLVDASKQLARGFSRRFLLCSLRNNAPTDYPDTLSLVCPLSLTTLGWALLGRDYGVVNRLIEQALSRDRGLLADRSNTSTEISELAAAVLGFHHDGQLPESVTNFTSNGTKKSPLSPELAFLIRYAELQQCFIVGNEELAVDRMIELLVTTSGGFAPLAHPSSMGTSIPDIGSAISTRLRLRLLSEVRHLLGRNCIRRDQVELLIASLVDIRFELQHSSYANQESISLLSRLHMLLARELASSVLPSNHSTVVLPSAIHPN
ncbi:unnamed protein product [Dicrocoelium dendriticum]|nr:unnamed protein product [Dicrocoelium dendriticum]